jgi:4-carboxymuconolactone decarboxylase
MARAAPPRIAAHQCAGAAAQGTGDGGAPLYCRQPARRRQTVYADPIMGKFVDLVTETVFGALWSRPGLDLKTRTLITVVSDVSTARTPELAIHLRMALRQGWTEDELVEAILHLSGYVGVPLVREALIVATAVFAESRTEGEQ